jgi:hypothetical protein
MKKPLLGSVLVAFACVSLQAGEACCDKSKATTCSAAKKTVTKADTSVKGATLLVRR